MAFISLASKTWGSGPAITLNPSYEKKRDGANMLYRVKMSIASLTGESWFGYPIYMKTISDHFCPLNKTYMHVPNIFGVC